MSRTQFQLAYDGPGLRNGTMDVNELASSLLAVGDLVREANAQLNGDKAEVAVRVKSDFKKGSFEIFLLLDQSLLEQAKGLLFPGAAAITGVGLIKLLFGTEIGKKGVSGAVQSVLDLWKIFKGEKPKDVIEDNERGITILVQGDGNQVNVGSEASNLYAKDSIRSAITGVIRPLTKQGVTNLEIRKGQKTINQVQKADLPPPERLIEERASNVLSANVRQYKREALLRVTRANFEKGKWGFSDGAASFSAEIIDQDFKQKLDVREIGFYKGDRLRVTLTTTQVMSAEGEALKTNYEIEKIFEHTHSPKQRLLE